MQPETGEQGRRHMVAAADAYKKASQDPTPEAYTAHVIY
jgi:hypothetical protein